MIFFLRVSLSPLRGTLSPSQTNISRKTSGTKVYLKGCINDLLQKDGYLHDLNLSETIIRENFREFSRTVFKFPCRIDIHIILEPLKISRIPGNFRAFHDVANFLKNFQEFLTILEINSVPENSWESFR